MDRRQLLIASSCVLAHGSPLAGASPAERKIRVTLPEAHQGTKSVDTRLLDSYGKPPEKFRLFYLDARDWFESHPQADFTDSAIVDMATAHGLALMGGPMLGDLSDDGVSIWLRKSTSERLEVLADNRTFPVEGQRAGQHSTTRLTGLEANTSYQYQIVTRGSKQVLGSGTFRTAPSPESRGRFRLAFGSCCHKIGVHNPNLFSQVTRRAPHAMLLLGDIAVDDRNNRINMHRADYQLRDTSRAWSRFVADTPVFASWDDHDYFDNDLSGIPRKFTPADRDAVRQVWQQNWNNPRRQEPGEGIYFRTRLGPVEIIMLDTRSCRNNGQRNEYGSYLGQTQMEWLKATLLQSTAPFKVISSGTMWSDYVSNAKDSWGSWDREAREEIFSLIEHERIGGVLLISGDRHGARGFRIPRPSGFSFYEFEPATLGGVSGPRGKVPGCPEQIFGYSGQDAFGNDFIAFGEFTFDTGRDDPQVTFRLIRENGQVLEEHPLSLQQLTPA